MKGMTKTGRAVIYDNVACEVVGTVPSHDEWNKWTEWVDADGEVTWASDDPDGYYLNAEEFWGGDEPS